MSSNSNLQTLEVKVELDTKYLTNPVETESGISYEKEENGKYIKRIFIETDDGNINLLTKLNAKEKQMVINHLENNE